MRTELIERARPHAVRDLLVRRVINGPTMGTRYSAVFFAPAEADTHDLHFAMQAAVDAVDAQMSTWKPDSDLMRFNRAPVGTWFAVPGQLSAVLGAALEVGRLSDGAFDIGVGDLVDAWGFGSSGCGPDLGRIERARSTPRVPAHVCLEHDDVGRRVRKYAQITLDISGIAKGFGVDQLAGVLASRGIEHYLVSIDGELRAAGGKPDGAAWRVAVERPTPGRREAEGILELTEGAIATSGDYRHFVEIEGFRYAHTMDPRRQAPLIGEIAAVTVLADACTTADAWATALLVLGPTAGAEIAANLGLEALFIERPPHPAAVPLHS
jgi:thiamine biosynthesis lipoprotein